MNRIKECRMNCNMSQKYVAMTLGVAAPSVSHWESGKTQPTTDNLKRLASLFGVSVDYLLGKEAVDFELKKQPAAHGSELDDTLVSLLVNLDPREIQRVRDFVQGMKASKVE